MPGIFNASIFNDDIFNTAVSVGAVISPTFNLRPRKVKRKKRREESEIPEEVIVEVPPDLPQSSLQQVLSEMERAGFELKTEQEQDDMLVLTFALKLFPGQVVEIDSEDDELLQAFVLQAFVKTFH